MNLHCVVFIGFLLFVMIFYVPRTFGVALWGLISIRIFNLVSLLGLTLFIKWLRSYLIRCKHRQSRHTRHGTKFNVNRSFDYMGPPSTMLNVIFFTFSLNILLLQRARQRYSSFSAPPLTEHTLTHTIVPQKKALRLAEATSRREFLDQHTRLYTWLLVNELQSSPQCYSIFDGYLHWFYIKFRVFNLVFNW